MSRVYLVRHGQAGTRKAYDSLSDLGRKQSRLLGEHLAALGVRFAAAYSGEMTRQRQTGEEVREAFLNTGAPFPEIQQEPRWNEFDLDHVYRRLAPQLAAEDDEFAREYAELRASARAAEGDPDAAVNRRWMPSDIKVVAAWLRATHPYDGESWAAFQTKVASNHELLARAHSDSDVVVFTSATPVGIFAARTMDVTDERVMKLAGAVHNASYSVVRLRGDDSSLHTFNAVPHLISAGLRTYR